MNSLNRQCIAQARTEQSYVGSAPHIEKRVLSTYRWSAGSTSFSSDTVGPNALGYCSVTWMGSCSARAPRAYGGNHTNGISLVILEVHG